MTAELFDDTPCELGEGPLWHPTRGQLFWFDILSNRLHSHAEDRTLTWQFQEHVSAAGWIDDARLLIASETQLFAFDVETGKSEHIAPLEADDPATRSNDGRADPYGGFWIGTMSKDATAGAGAIYRYYRGELRTLHHAITIPNAICFSPDGRHAYFTDTLSQKVMRQLLDDSTGWPIAEAELWLDLSETPWMPDGAVVDAEGNFWNAQWGGHRVAAYSAEGEFLRAVTFPPAHTSCPAFGGPELTTLFCTSARELLTAEQIASAPENGMTYSAPSAGIGQREHQVIL